MILLYSVKKRDNTRLIDVITIRKMLPERTRTLTSFNMCTGFIAHCRLLLLLVGHRQVENLLLHMNSSFFPQER